MADPVIEFYESDDVTLITNDATNPISFGTGLSVGSNNNEPTDAAQFPFHLWNDNGGGAGADQAINIKIFVKDENGGNTGQFVLGTAGNGNTPFYKARSFGSFGAVDDNQVNFTPIGGSTFLSIGNMSSNQNRHIFVALDIPADAAESAGIDINKITISFDSTP